MDLVQYIGHNQVPDHPSRCQHNIRRYYSEFILIGKLDGGQLK